MDVLVGPYLAAATLLVLAGAGKVRDPMSLVRALRPLGLRPPAVGVRVLAAAEAALGVAALLTSARPVAAAVAASYAVFSGVVVVARARGGVLASCGCFGRLDTPATRLHAVLTAALAGVGAAMAVRPWGGLRALLADAPGHGVPLLLTAAALAAVGYLLLALLPLLTAAARRPAASR